MSVAKWLPREDVTTTDFIKCCKKLHVFCGSLEEKLGELLVDDDQIWEDLTSTIETILPVTTIYSTLASTIVPQLNIHYGCKFWHSWICEHRLTLLYLTNQVINIGLKRYKENGICSSNLLRLIVFFNGLHDLNLIAEVKGVSVVKNTCPSLLQPVRRHSLTRILQVLVQHQGEQDAQFLLEIIIDIYHGKDVNPFTCESPNIDDDTGASSDNSSIEVYKALTRYMTPPHGTGHVSTPIQKSDVPILDSLLEREDSRLIPFLNKMALVTPKLLGPSAVKKTKSGHLKIRRKVQIKICEYYRSILWGEVGGFLEHILLWWSSTPMGAMEPHAAHQFLNWLKNYTTTVILPDLIRPPLHSLLDSLCCHVTSTSWDQLFRKALVAAGHQHSRHVKHDVEQGSWTGVLFSEMFFDLVALNNSCEGSNWTLADLEDLPLVEQIPVLHRLDHSVHTARLWAASRARQLANQWNIDQFFRVTQSDVKSSLHVLTSLRHASQVELLGPESSVHVSVCCKMRAKLVSEVKANIQQLQKVPTECVAVLATVCRTFSLANLRMIFPPAIYWKQSADEVPQFASNYVEDYLEVVLRPVLLASNPFDVPVQQNVCGLVLHIMCEAWLDHITTHRIKFSEWGALQLLTDFGAVPTWLLERVTLTNDVRKHLLNTEVLRRCEGVGRLLLRRPGERIAMSSLPSRKAKQETDEEGNTSQTAEMMPPEMYVPNQEQWLQLRAPRQTKSFALCCSNT